MSSAVADCLLALNHRQCITYLHNCKSPRIAITALWGLYILKSKCQRWEDNKSLALIVKVSQKVHKNGIILNRDGPHKEIPTPIANCHALALSLLNNLTISPNQRTSDVPAMMINQSTTFRPPLATLNISCKPGISVIRI